MSLPLHIPPRPLLLVGNGPSLLGKRLGPVIDNFPHVARLNSYKTEGFELDVGTRTSIWVRSRRLPTIQPRATADAIWIAIPHSLRTSTNVAAAFALLGDASDRAMVIPRDDVARDLQTAIYDSEDGGEWPSTGLLAIAHAIDGGGEVTIAGFDSWSTEPFHYYGPHDRTGTHHDPARERAHIQDLVQAGVVEALR